MLFQENTPRTEGPAKRGESGFSYLQRSSRPEAIRICQWANKWFDALPIDKKSLFESKLKATKAETFIGQWFELLVYRMLRNLGLCVDIEPDLHGTRNKIDFLAYPPGRKERCFYLEATVSGFEQGNLRLSKNELDAAGKIKQRIRTPHSDLWLEADGALDQSLNARCFAECVIKPFRELLDQTSREEILRIASSGQHWNLPCRKIEVPSNDNRRKKSSDNPPKKWGLKGQLRPPHHPSGMGQVIGPSRGGACDASTSLCTSLKEKADKWKRFDFKGAPFLVAVDACNSEFFWGENDTMDIRRALFGDSSNEGHSGDFRRSLRCISGVVLFNHAVLRNEIGSEVRLFRNGSATIPEPLHFLLEEQRLGRLLGIEP